MPNPGPAEPVEPSPTRWALPDPRLADPGQDLVGVGADLGPGTLLAAYRTGLFPMHLTRRPLRSRLGWWSPDPRGVLPLDGLRVSRSLRQAVRRYEIRVDSAFAATVDLCADPGREGGWITPDIRDAYVRLHRLGWAHSVEAWAADPGTGAPRLAGGLYGIAVGGLFAGESMGRVPAPWSRDASKVALVALVELLRATGTGDRVLDVQWHTDHLAGLGAVAVPRAAYLDALARAVRSSPPDWGRRPGCGRAGAGRGPTPR